MIMLAEYFGVSVDFLLTGERKEPENPEEDLISQLENKNNAIRIRFEDEFQRQNAELHIEIWGDANIEVPDNRGRKRNLRNGTKQYQCKCQRGMYSHRRKYVCSMIGGNAVAGCSISFETIGGNAKVSGSIEYQ